MKNNIKIMIAFVLGALIFGGIGVYAAIKIQADEIGYKDGTVEAALNDLYDKADGKLGQTYSSFNFGHERLTNMSTTINQLPKGKYLCYANYSAASRIADEANYESSGNSTVINVSGCDSISDVKKHFDVYGGATTINNGYNLIQDQKYIFECNLDSAKNVSVSHSSTAANWLPWTFSLDCTSIE